MSQQTSPRFIKARPIKLTGLDKEIDEFNYLKPVDESLSSFMVRDESFIKTYKKKLRFT